MKSGRPYAGLQIIVSLLLAFVVQGESLALDIYVAVDGHAQADGSLARPYGSLPDALKAVRALRRADNTKPVKIILREGRHQLNQTLVLGPDDGSPLDSKPVNLPKYGAGDTTGPAFLTFAAYPGEKPVVSGAVPITGWKRLKPRPSALSENAVGKVWVADMPAGLDRFYTLYDNQGRLNRARGAGFLPTKPGDKRTLHFPKGSLKNWDMFDRPTALLRFRGAEDCRVTDCRFVDSGGSGLRMDLYAQRNRVTNCELAHLGEAGILLAGYGPGTKDVNHHNDIINNHIHHFSEITWHSPGLWAWQSGHNRMVHNELHHSGYSAVLITTRVEPNRSLNGEGGRTVRRHEIAAEDKNRRRGGYESWKARAKYNHSRHNLFAYNEISHAVQLLSDGNGIYISGTGTGNIIRYNFLHDNLSPSMPAAIRCDDDQYETLIYGNVLYHNAGFAAAIASKGVNDIINNFIVAPASVPGKGYISFEWVPVTGSKVQRNIIISHPEGGKAQSESVRRGQTSRGPKLETTDNDQNLYYHPTDSHWADDHLARMQAAGLEKASLFGDPLFVDPTGGDFSFRPGSPALALGIEPLDVSKMGRLDDRSLLNSDGN